MTVKEKAGWARFAGYLYCAVLLFVGYGQMLRKLTSDTGGPISQFAPPLLATFLVMGIAAHLNQKAVFSQWFWKLLFGILSIGSMGVLLLAVYYAFSQGMALVWQALTLATVLLLFPALLFLRRYAFYSPVWSEPGR